MSGSTLGGIAGGVIGFYVGGAKGAQLGWMIGSAVGGYVDPDVIKGQRLSDAQVQTSNEGIARPIIYGTAVVAGNVIQSGPLVETKTSERTGKGGPVQETYHYSRTYAIRVCEASPLGTCRISRIWRDDKLVYDTRSPTDFPDEAAAINALRADSATFASKLTVFTGSESQLPSATLEALPAANGGGVGTVPAYRGSCHVVFANDDLTERQGSIPQYRFEVVSVGSVVAGTTMPTFGAQTHSYTLPSDATYTFQEYAPNYIGQHKEGLWASYSDPTNGIAGNEAYEWLVLDDSLTALLSGNVTCNAASGNAVGYFATNDNKWSIDEGAAGNGGNVGACELRRNGTYLAQLRPVVGSASDWYYGQGLTLPEFGGMIWFTKDLVYVGVREAGSPSEIRRRIYQFGLDSVGVTAALNTSPLITTGSKFFCHMDRSGLMWAIAVTEDEIIRYDGTLIETRATLPFATSGVYAFGVDSGYLFIYYGASSKISVYNSTTYAFVQDITITGSQDPWNCQIVFSNSSIFLRAGRYIKRIAYTATCMVGLPIDWYTVPDQPDYVVSPGGDMFPICGTEPSTVSGTNVALSAIVTDLCDRVDVEAAQLDVTQLTDTVRGFVVGRQLPASEAIRSLQQGYFFDFPEWDLKLRGIKRGGASLFAITDALLVESGDDEDTRAQAVEFPRKINLITSDPSVSYEPTKQTAERRTSNIKAVGEATVELPIVLTRNEQAGKVDVMLKVAWTEAEGRWERELPEEYSQLTPSDPFTFGGKRWRAERVEYGDGAVKVDAVRDRISAYTSAVTGSTGLVPVNPVSNVRGPTVFVVMNLPSLRTQDNQPGVYVAACGLLPGWAGCQLQMSIDAGVSYTNVLTMTNPAVIGTLALYTDADGNDSNGLLTVDVIGTLESVTAAQVVARANAFALISADVAEIGQFRTATLNAAGYYDLREVIRGELDTIAAVHNAGDDFVLLDENVYFLPVDVSQAGKTLRFRPVSLGTAEANATVYTIVYSPPTYVLDGGAA